VPEAIEDGDFFVLRLAVWLRDGLVNNVAIMVGIRAGHGAVRLRDRAGKLPRRMTESSRRISRYRKQSTR
jgi:hypothetical protein